jgi:hypothetical protein
MKNNNHSFRIWELIRNYARAWNLDNWNPYSEQVVNFTIKNHNFTGSISIQEITNVMSDKYGLFAVAFQEKGCAMPNVQFLARGEVADFIDGFCKLKWGAGDTQRRAIGQRAPMDVNVAKSAN